MFFPEYREVKDTNDKAVIRKAIVNYGCMGCLGTIEYGTDVIDLRTGWVCHDNLHCYNLMKSFGERHAERLEAQLNNKGEIRGDKES